MKIWKPVGTVRHHFINNYTVIILQPIKHWWFNGRILACDAGDRGSSPANATSSFLNFSPGSIFFAYLPLYIRKYLSKHLPCVYCHCVS